MGGYEHTLRSSHLLAALFVRRCGLTCGSVRACFLAGSQPNRRCAGTSPNYPARSTDYGRRSPESHHCGSSRNRWRNSQQ